jgi:hypothetical protein
MNNPLAQKYNYYLNESHRLSEELKNEQEYSELLENILLELLSEEQLNELFRKEGPVKNPAQVAKRLSQMAQIKAHRTTQQKPGAVEAGEALKAHGAGDGGSTTVGWSGSLTGNAYDSDIAKDSGIADQIGRAAAENPHSTEKQRQEADAERKRLRDSRKGTSVLRGGKKVGRKRNGYPI